MSDFSNLQKEIVMQQRNNRRYYLHKKAKEVNEAILKVHNRTIEVSYTVDSAGILENKYIDELTRKYGYSLQIVIDK